MKRLYFTLLLACLCFAMLTAANTTKRVVQVNNTVTLTDDVDYVITSPAPFGDNGVVDIVNTEHAVLILDAVKPSKALSLLSHVKINGERATSNTNCQVKIYNRGCIIMPYPANIKPLTVFSGKNFEGVAVSDFGLENSGGFMNTLSDAKLNNRIQSFKLKRGYMVTFSTLPRGRGYSRCFIAATQDIEMAELPDILAGRISSYRIFKWNDTSKSGIANDTRQDPCSKLNVTSCYSFGLGEDRGIDTECVPHHIYEDWPSASACGSVTYSPHMKTNNEPGNSADDHPQSVDEILNNWENLMATGMRLCSPSSHDGSLNHLRAFMDSIDARGWRCDIIDLHCYWPEGSFNNIKGSWVDTYKRPIWISEWVWGASWNNNGIFGVATGTYRDNPTESQLQQNKTAVQSICTKLNSWDYIERYYYWNSEANCSKIYRDGKLTPAGEYYAGMNTGLGYNGKYEFIPTHPRQYGPANFKVTNDNGKCIVTWRDLNGEYNQLMEVQRKPRGGQWETIAVIEQKEMAANYTYTDENAPEGAAYRVHIIDLEGVEYYTNDDLQAGDAVIAETGQRLFAGGNIVVNGEFDMGMYDWTSGNGNPIDMPYFQVVKKGGYNGGAYLQAYGSGGMDHVASLKKVFTLQPNREYVFSMASRNAGSYLRLSLSEDGVAETATVARLATTTEWRKQSFTFNSGNYDKALLALRWLNANGQLDKIEIRPLFATREEAVADGVEKAKLAAAAMRAANTDAPLLNDDIEAKMNAISSNDDNALYAALDAIDCMTEALEDLQTIDSLKSVAASVKDMAFDGKEALEAALDNAGKCTTAEEVVAARKQLQEALERFFPTDKAATQPVQPNFASTNGWEVKAGTYKGGDQRLNTVGGKTCWNAWWSNVSAAQGKAQTMAVRQELENLPEGLYLLECKATTQHYCISDQHGYLVCNGDTAVTPTLQYDYFDLPTVGGIWQTLTTTPLYVEEGGKVTIGFESSKQGAVDNAWHAFGEAGNNGDRREGWWCATDFMLRFHPLHKHATERGVWKTICLPFAYRAPEDAKCYVIAGILPGHDKVAIRQVDVVEAGQPVIYIAEADNLVFYEYGEQVANPIDYTTQNNLRGFFQTAARAPKGSFVLTDGKWLKVGDDRPRMDSYSAIIYTLDGMDELDSWEGLTMPLEDPTAIRQTTTDTNAPTRTYTIGGAPAGKANGVLIEVKGDKARKVVRK
ncbi:MAG: carbohydrate binding domain-containing protein [Prevotella sp.]|nr:carbohydrate binding domain-containing protein [Prevotella sp.]